MVGDRMIRTCRFPLVRVALRWVWVWLVGGAQDRDALGRRRDWKSGLDPNGASKRSSE
jgi:hypothetical protein